MLYFDYSATTPVDEAVIQDFVLNSRLFYGNPNSNHYLGKSAYKALIDNSHLILNTLNLSQYEVIYTSGATEANNLAIKGYCQAHQHLGKHIILSPYEHSSVVASFSYLESQGFDVDILEPSSNGLIQLDNLEKLIRKDTIFISIAAINSETGVLQNLGAIVSFLKDYPRIGFHSDVTQMIGKIKFDISGIDLMSMSAHKFYGFKGVGCLIRKDNVQIEPLIHGGHSLSSTRSGTPATPLNLSLGYALNLANQTLDNDYEHIKMLNQYLVNELTHFPNIIINSNQYSIPHILNISILNKDANQIQKELNELEVYVSTQSACSAGSPFSQVIYKMTNDVDRAKSSIRISLSKHTTLNDVNKLIEYIKEVLK